MCVPSLETTISSQVKNDNVPPVVDQKRSWNNGFEKCWLTPNPVRMLSFELRVISISPMLSSRIGEEMTKKNVDRGGAGGWEGKERRRKG